jgi:hypothetical protein
MVEIIHQRTLVDNRASLLRTFVQPKLLKWR